MGSAFWVPEQWDGAVATGILVAELSRQAAHVIPDVSVFWGQRTSQDQNANMSEVEKPPFDTGSSVVLTL